MNLVREIKSITGGSEVTGQNWEEVRYKTKTAIENWIDKKMIYKKAVIVLVGRHTAERPYVKYEIEHAWSMKKPLLVKFTGTRTSSRSFLQNPRRSATHS